MNPSATATGLATLKVSSFVDQTGAITAGGRSVTAVVSKPGAVSRFTFAAAAGQTVTLDATGATLTACGLLTIHDAADTVIGSACLANGVGTTGPVTLTAGGPYAVVFDPGADALGRVTVRLPG